MATVTPEFAKAFARIVLRDALADDGAFPSQPCLYRQTMTLGVSIATGIVTDDAYQVFHSSLLQLYTVEQIRAWLDEAGREISGEELDSDGMDESDRADEEEERQLEMLGLSDADIEFGSDIEV